MTDRRRRQRDDSRADQELVMQVALGIAARVGFDGTRMSAVAKESGKSESFVYWYFQNKDTLLARAIEYGYERRRSRGQTWNTPARGAERYDMLLRNFTGPEGFEATEHEPWRLGLILSLELRDTAAEKTFAAKRGETIRRVHEWWMGSLDTSQMTDPEAVALFLTHLTLAAHDGHFLARAVRNTSSGHTRAMLAAGMEAVARAMETGERVPQPHAPGCEPDSVAAADNVRQALLHAAEADVSARGPDAASVAAICDAAGVPPTSLYWWFGDRSTLVAKAITEIHNRWRAVAPSAESTTSSRFSETLRAYSEGLLVAMQRQPGLPRVLNMEALRHDPTDSEAHALLQTIRVGVHMDLAQLLARILPRDAGACADQLAHFTLAVADGLFVASAVDGHYRALDDLAPTLTTMVHGALFAMVPDLDASVAAR